MRCNHAQVTKILSGCGSYSVDFNYIALWYAVELDNCLSGMTIEDCQFHDNGSAAIYLYNSNPDIEGCNV